MKRLLRISILMIAILLLIKNYNYAVVEIKDTTSVVTNKTISQFYDMAEEMTSAGQGLESATVDVKMANNYEWAVVSYFSNSNYGTGGAGQNTGVDVSQGLTTTHKSTNGNITGVMDWGKTDTYTAGITKSYATSTLTTAGGQSIINAAGTDKVDKFSNVGGSVVYDIAKTGWYSSENTLLYDASGYPYSFRRGIFGIYSGSYLSSGNLYASDGGNRYSKCTFRPVFYAP